MFSSKTLEKYFVLGTQNTNDEENFFEVLTEALQGGITLFQYREKDHGALKGHEKVRVAKKIRQLTAQYHVPLVIDDDISLAHEIGADGVHFGQKDGNIVENIKSASPLFVGISVSSMAEYKKIKNIQGIDYIGIGPVFSTTSKEDANPAIGLTGLAPIVQESHWPSVAIGGITEENLASIISTQVNGIAVISMISQSSNVRDTIKFWNLLLLNKK
ncbi:thiamine-phosphate synthase [Leuconostoc litchii]|uniref:Thiamine-phosphate synthase n=1 Tax=Leuconostoc litchii TaxID=1981069 RepID=A0A6P2CPX0_9LACO|nr:thiamine phosphate synthase [Leuconostoc litchii]TYC47433.1 thiamine phosphate synthase [Leuconostoc litchii]GMA69450.1 thiamine-phosphate synthase [Leuconostoc litchii]